MFTYYICLIYSKLFFSYVLGCGDSPIYDMCYLPDPCPLPEKLKKRSLVDKERLVYAPFSGVGGIVYDKDAVYVELGGSHSHSKVCISTQHYYFCHLIYLHINLC